MDPETRSLNGCWECRLRKKKCDEKRPTCTECIRVGFECHGLGDKPEWIDKGSRQKAQAAKTKQKVAQAIKSRRMSKHRARSLTESIPLLTAAASTGTSNTTASNSTSDSNDNSGSNAPSISNSVGTLYHDPSLSISIPSQTNATIPSLQALDKTVPSLQSAITPLSPYNHPSNFDSGYQSALDDMSYLTTPRLDLSDVDILATDNVTESSLLAELTDQRTGTSPFDFPTDMSLTDGHNRPELSIASVEDADLLAHYVGKTFQWQFRFINPGENAFNQGYFLWLMSKYRPLYTASLALSSSHKSFSRAGDSPQPDLAYEKHAERYRKAGSEFRLSQGTQDAVGSIGMLACIVSFLCSSLLHADKGEWNTHLQTGVALIRPWIVQQPSGVGPETQNSVENTTRSFFISFLMRFHILSAITQEAAPSLSATYKRVLNSDYPRMPLDRVSGCENWVFSLILDVYLLRDWRRSCRTAGRLSLWELTSKANGIKHELEARISKGAKELEARKNDRLSDGISPIDYDISVTTHIFACAVSVLLEVVVSGWYPHLPEIRENVERTIEAFAYIEDSELMDALGWPLFVVGCVVAEEQYELMRQMLWSSPIVRHSGVGGMLENCWKMRERGQVKSDTFDFSLFRSCGAHDILVA